MNAALLQTKLYLPIPRPDRVPRPRLTAALDSALQPGGKLTLISAPAGSGKTTLVSTWLQELVRRQAQSPDKSSALIPIYEPCWLSLDKGDNDLARFLVYLVATLERVAPGLGEGALSLLRGPQPPPVENFLTALINDLSTLTEEDGVDRWLLLVLDDYHVIEAQAVHDALAFLLDHLPGEMRLVLISRTEPPLPLARLRGRGHLLTLDGGDLRFNIDEARQFLNRVMGLDLSQDEITSLATRTEGWIAGLQMAALAAQRSGSLNGPDRPADQAAGNRLIMDYLLQEVLQSQPDELQAFLLYTSILDRLSAPLCDALTGQEDSQAILAELERRNLFLFPLDQEGRWYRYHHLFAELLRQRLGQSQPQTMPSLHRRAGAWYRANGFIAEAIQHTLAAGDGQAAAVLVEQAADPALMRGQFLTILGWLRLLPPDVVRARPRLAVYQALLMLLDSQPVADIEAVLRAAEKTTATGFAAEEPAPVTGEIMLIRAILALLLGDLQTSADLSRQAMTQLPEDAPFLNSLALRNLASVHSMIGDVPAAGEALAEAVALAESMDDKTSLVMSLYSLARTDILQGRLHSARDHLNYALSTGRDSRGRPLPVVARVLTSLADVKREWNELNEAGRLVQDGIELTKQALAFWGIGAYVILAQIRQAEGDIAAAQTAINTALDLAARFDATDLDDRTVELYQARLWLMQGNVEAVDRWATQLPGDETRSRPQTRPAGQMAGWYVVHELEQIHLARLHLAHGRPEEARTLLETLRPAAENHQRMGIVLTIDLLLALAWYSAGNTARALATLEPALARAEVEGFVRLFVDEGQAMADLLKLVPATSPLAGYAGRLAAAFPTSSPVLDKESTPAITGQGVPEALTEPLGGRQPEQMTGRELDVLRLLPTHLTSTEIAAELSISPNTARFHIKNIYSKLAAHNRAEAVAQARQLGLL